MVIFPLFRVSLEGSLLGFVLARFRDSIWRVFQLNLECFWDAFGTISYTERRNEKCGLDTVWPMFAPDRHVENSCQIVPKSHQRWTRYPEPCGTAFWAPFWRASGSLWGALGRQIGEKKGTSKSVEKNAKKKSIQRWQQDARNARPGPYN